MHWIANGRTATGAPLPRLGRVSVRRPPCAAAAMAVMAVLLSSLPAAADKVRGGWSALGDWPLVPIHAVLTPDGRVLTYGTDRQGVQTGRFDYDVWDPKDGLGGGHLTLPNSTRTDLFCSAQIVLPQSGDVLLAGGDNWTGSATTNLGNNDTNLFSPARDSLTPAAPMSRPRWYATLTTMPNGETYIQGGKGGPDRPEIRGVDGGFRLLDGADTSDLYYWYPRNWVAPDGRVFGYADRSMYFVDPTGAGTVSAMGLMQGNVGGVTSSEVMYAPGKILRCGGGATFPGSGEDGLSGTATIDINGPVPKVTERAAMPIASHWHTATVGADGRVFVTGGGTGNNNGAGPIFNAQIWNPVTGTWTLGAATTSQRMRLYHSTALLLPDASILVAGGGAPGPQDNLNAEIYYPPYLYDGTGRRATRPSISAAPASIGLGQSFALAVGNAASIGKVTLVKTGSVTHSFNMDQRFLRLTFTVSGAGLQVVMPSSPAAAPPGNYLLFAIDKRGVPSVGKVINVQVAANPTVAVDWSPTVGARMDGAGFTLACPSGMAVVGVFGGGSRIARIGPRCAPIGSKGRWTGAPRNGDGAGSSGAIEFERTCAADTVVSGFRARTSGLDLTQIELACRALDSGGRVTGGATFLEPVGTDGDEAHGPFACTSGKPARAIYGRASGIIHSFGVMCRRPA